MRLFTVAALHVVVASLLVGCTVEPLTTKRFAVVLTPVDVNTATGLEVGEPWFEEEAKLIASEVGAWDAYALEDSYRMTYRSLEGVEITLRVWQFATDRHARERLDWMVRSTGLTASQEQVGNRSAEGIGGDGGSFGLDFGAVFAFQKDRLVVGLQAVDPDDVAPHQDGLRKLALLVHERL